MTAPTTHVWEIEARDLRVKAGRRSAIDGVPLTIGARLARTARPQREQDDTDPRATVQRPASKSLSLLGGMELRGLRCRVGYLPQEFGHYRRFAVREFRRVHGVAQRDARMRHPGGCSTCCRKGRPGRLCRRSAQDPVGGMVRRVGIAQAIVNAPKVLLLDKPKVGQDPAQRLRFHELFTELGTDACVVVSTHLVEDVAAACTDVAWLSSGKVVFQGTPAQFAAAGIAGHAGDTLIGRGYSAALSTPSRRHPWCPSFLDCLHVSRVTEP